MPTNSPYFYTDINIIYLGDEDDHWKDNNDVYYHRDDVANVFSNDIKQIEYLGVKQSDSFMKSDGW